MPITEQAQRGAGLRRIQTAPVKTLTTVPERSSSVDGMPVAGLLGTVVALGLHQPRKGQAWRV